jgi:hypothetical protein
MFSKTANNLYNQKNHPSVRTEIPRNLYYRKLNTGDSCQIINNKVMKSSIYDENTKGNSEPLCDKKHILFEFSLMSEIWHYFMGWG